MLEIIGFSKLHSAMSSLRTWTTNFDVAILVYVQDLVILSANVNDKSWWRMSWNRHLSWRTLSNWRTIYEFRSSLKGLRCSWRNYHSENRFWTGWDGISKVRCNAEYRKYGQLCFGGPWEWSGTFENAKTFPHSRLPGILLCLSPQARPEIFFSVGVLNGL